MIQTKTLKEALKDPGVIEVVEELIGTVNSNNTGLAPNYGFINRTESLAGVPSYDSITESGIYVIGNKEWSPVNYGTLIVFNDQSTTIVQIAIAMNAAKVYIRAKWTETWGNWKQIV